MGSGKQWQSWIHIDDEVGAIVHLLTSEVEGPVNLTAPNPVPQAGFADAMGDVLNRPTFMYTPKFAPKLVLGSELADNLLFEGQNVVPAVLERDGYTFEYPDLDGALRDLLGKSTDAPVAIVGAGLAGLACATTLHAAGLPVQVFEASDGVGGRVRSDIVEGFTLDRGFQVALDRLSRDAPSTRHGRPRPAGVRSRCAHLA